MASGEASAGERTGHCLCGGIRYAVRGGLGPAVNCHCRFCRRAHGGPFVTVAMVSTPQLSFREGADLVREVHTAGVGTRAFCSRCGTRLFNRPESAPRITMLVVGTLDDESDIVPSMHVNLESKAPWYEIRDELPRFQALPPAAASALDEG